MDDQNKLKPADSVDPTKDTTAASTPAGASQTPPPADPVVIPEPVQGQPNLLVTPDGQLQEIRQHSNRNIPVLIVYLVGALMVAFIVVFGARFIYHKVHHSKTTTVTPAANDAQKVPAAPGTTAPAKNSGTNNNASGSQTTPSTNSGSNSSSQPAPTTSPLPNTGG